MTDLILTINAGSSSIKAAAFALETLDEAARAQTEVVAGHEAALAALLDDLRGRLGAVRVAAVGHRVVHGGPDFDAPVVLDAAAEAKLATYVPLAPLHQPHNLACVAAARHTFPDAVQVACFDTAFHRGRPWASETFALPRRYADAGVRRYGFHGTSYEYIAGRLAEIAPEVAAGKVIVAHLGNGASMCAIKGGRSVETTMGFSPLEGLTMGTRPGRLDAGAVLYMLQHEGLSSDDVARILNTESGLLGLSGVASDMRALAASDAPEAAEAIDHFVYRARIEAGGLVAALGGLDALVFTGGIGENAPDIRARIGAGLGWLGLAIDEAANQSRETEISAAGSRVRAFVIPTDEERQIARHAKALVCV